MRTSTPSQKREHVTTTVSEIDNYTIRQLAGLAELRDIARVQLMWADTTDMPVITDDLIQAVRVPYCTLLHRVWYSCIMRNRNKKGSEHRGNVVWV